MTLLVALHGSNGIVLASDSRGTFGDPRQVTAQNDSMQKLFSLSDHTAVLISGASELGSLIVTKASETIHLLEMDGITEITEQLRDVARKTYADSFPSLPAVQVQNTGGILAPVTNRPDLAFIVAGYDKGETRQLYDVPRMFTLASGWDFPPQLHTYGFALAGIATYALYLLNRLYEPNRTVEELTALAVYVITETASQDGKVGGPVQVATISAIGTVILEPDSVTKVINQNAERAKALRDSFYQARI